MSVQANSTTTSQAVQAYSKGNIEGATPGELVLHTYNYVISQLRKRDMVTSKRGVVELQASLDLDHLDIAGPLFRIYEYTCDTIRAGNYEEAEKIITDLRDTWKKILDAAETGAGLQDQA
jgi:flagellin-specific chaperone FliS